MGYRNYSIANGFVVDPAGNGDFTTIASALTAAVSGDTIFIRPGTYTTNLTLKAGVNLTAFDCDAQTPNVSIVGKITMTVAGTVTISGIQLTTNNDYFLEVTGTAASAVILDNCYLNILNNTGMHLTSNGGSSIQVLYCAGNIATTGITLFVATSGTISIKYTDIENNGNSTTASTGAAMTLFAEYCIFGCVFSFTTTGIGGFYYCYFNDGATINATAVTTAGTGATHQLYQCIITSGTASAVSIGANTTMVIQNSSISSSNTNAITGAGTLTISGTIFPGSSHLSNVTTQSGGAISGLTQGTAPSAGYIGEVISNSASAVATSNSTAKTITSINLTPGIWDVTAMTISAPAGGTALMQAGVLSVSATTNTQSAPQVQTNCSTLGVLGLTTLPTRITLSSSATYYCVVTNFYNSTTCPTTGYITATRVG